MVDPETKHHFYSSLPIIPLGTAVLDRTGVVTTFITLSGPIDCRIAPGPCRTSLCHFLTGKPMSGVQTGLTRNTTLDLDNLLQRNWLVARATADWVAVSRVTNAATCSTSAGIVVSASVVVFPLFLSISLAAL